MCQSLLNRTHAIIFLCVLAAGLQWITTLLCCSRKRGFLRIECLSNEFAVYKKCFLFFFVGCVFRVTLKQISCNYVLNHEIRRSSGKVTYFSPNLAKSLIYQQILLKIHSLEFHANQCSESRLSYGQRDSRTDMTKLKAGLRNCFAKAFIKT
jgi:hypothetical protein